MDTDNKTVGAGGIIMMIIFWFLVWLTGPGLLTVIYLVLTMGALALIAKFRGMSFGSMLGNNNWVFWTSVSMAAVSGFIAYLNPLTPQGAAGWIMRTLMRVPEVSGKGTLWGFVNSIFFGRPLTHGWSDAAFLYLAWSVPALAVSYWDETKALVKKLQEKGLKEGLFKIFINEGLGEFMWTPVKKLFGGKKP